MKDTAAIDRRVYLLAKNFLPGLNIDGVTPSLIEKYLNPFLINPKPTSKTGIYQRILDSAQNANMKSGVIGKAIGGVEKLSIILEGFEVENILKKYGDDWEAVLNDIVRELKPNGEIRREPRSIWPQFCRTIISAAHFLEQFTSVDDFFSWVDFFYQDSRAQGSLPLLLSREIEGLGFALSCDFLKELGYTNFPKPDVHLRDIFSSLNLYREKSGDYQLFKAIIRLAKNANVSAYNADKVFWLIGSGFFYDDPQIGNEGKIGSHKKEFIKYAQSILFENS